MTSRLRSLLLFLLILPASLHASTTAPMFAGDPGMTLTIHGETYNWTSPASEDGVWHTDTYTSTTDSALTLTVKGLMGHPGVATVNGHASSGTVNGYLSVGTYGDNQSSSNSDGSWPINGVTYTHLIDQTTYFVDYGNLDIGVNYDQQYTAPSTYTGPDANLHRWGTTGDQDHRVYWGNHNAPASGYNSITVFGATYTYSPPLSSHSTDEYSEDEVIELTGWIDTFTNANGSIKIISGTNINNNYTSYQLQVWNQSYGLVNSFTVSTLPSFSGSLTGITWLPRTAPTFARAQLWLDGSLLNWKSGTFASDGTITDTYSGAGFTLTISALANDYFAAGSTTAAAIAITSGGTGSGALAQGGSFILSGHDLQNAIPNSNVPLFAGPLLKVGSSNYAFKSGFENGGNRVDVYGNSSLGALTLAGPVSDTSQFTVQVSKNGIFYSGTCSAPPFIVNDSSAQDELSITQPNIQPAVPAFWVRGEFYKNSTAAPTIYVSTSSAGHSLTFNNSSGAWALQGTDGSGAFYSQCSQTPVGILVLQAVDEADTPISGAPVPALPANADGSLHLPSNGPGGDMPPAVRNKDGHFLVYLGTAIEDTNPATTAAYYGSAIASTQSPWLLKLRTDGSGTATWTNYSTGTSTTGSYSTQTHLFQTSAPGSGYPMPVNGVDPNANNALWGLSPPDSATGLPATFLVQGDIWRYTGTNSGVATYQGYYNNQQMTATALPQPDGGWVVQVTDPVHGDGTPTQGTLNDVRGSVRLRDGSEVYSGNFAGQPVIPTLNPNNLHTIAADLDITGNVITFGALSDSAATAGATFQFQDASLTASLSSILARPQAQWLWTHAADSSGQSTLPAMKLDPTHKLTLYDIPASGQTQHAGVVLDPTPDGVSSIRGVLRVRPGGDIDMGGFQAGGEP